MHSGKLHEWSCAESWAAMSLATLRKTISRIRLKSTGLRTHTAPPLLPARTEPKSKRALSRICAMRTIATGRLGEKGMTFLIEQLQQTESQRCVFLPMVPCHVSLLISGSTDVLRIVSMRSPSSMLLNVPDISDLLHALRPHRSPCPQRHCWSRRAIISCP